MENGGNWYSVGYAAEREIPNWSKAAIDSEYSIRAMASIYTENNGSVKYSIIL